KIKWAPMWLFGVLANLPKIKKAGKHDIILFSKWTLSHDLVGDTVAGQEALGGFRMPNSITPMSSQMAEMMREAESDINAMGVKVDYESGLLYIYFLFFIY
ncbi:MAG: hypothetical protein PUD66_03705, partial [Oscillospiraceae bacterium]|nr:hypothetical protein [Oscillospiraceae bacterium]